MVTPDNLDQVLMALKYAGVTRCRMGDFEVEFAPPESEAEDTSAPELAPADFAAPHTQGFSPKPHGYGALFPSAPRFTPAEE